jgi:hypothetical protein
MSTLTLEIRDELVTATTPEGKRSILAFIEAEFGGGKRLATLNPAHLTPGDEAALDEAYQAIEEGRMHRFDADVARARAKELLSRS